MPIDSRPRLLGPARAGRERVRVVLQLPAASSEPAGPDARPTAPSLFPAAPDVTYVLGQYTRSSAGPLHAQLRHFVNRAQPIVSIPTPVFRPQFPDSRPSG